MILIYIRNALFKKNVNKNSFSKCAVGDEVIGDIGPMGQLRGVVKQAKVYPGAPHSARTIYKFRNIPYAEYSIAGQYRFSQSEVRTTPYTLQGEEPFDATQTGPLCQQGTLTEGSLESIFDSTLEDFLVSALPDIIEGFVPHFVISVLLQTIELLVEVPKGTLDPSKTVKEVAHDWLDVDLHIDEECLHLAVSTPVTPNGVEKPLLPVMFYIHGGGFSSGFQIKMGPERLMAWGDVVVVAINYRLNILGFMCLDTDEAAGNMGMLDMVTALEWAHNNIAYFGGDPNQITIFGESAGSAAIGHMLLGQTAPGIFAQGIGSSGSPLAAWAFDHEPEKHARMVAREAGCSQEDADELVTCMKSRDAASLTAAFDAFQKEERKQGRLGFGGSSPCAQSKGKKKFYLKGQTPQDVLFSGNYEHVPMFFGANKKEGAYVYTVLFNEYLVPNGLDQDPEFMRYGYIPKLMEATEVSNYYGFKELLYDNYFDEGQIGDLYQMIPGIEDLLSVFFFKASAYELIQQNSKYSPSYWYGFDYSDSQKSLFNLQYINPADKANLTHPGTSHGDESIYLFDIEIPLVFCNIKDIALDAIECLSHIDAVFCLTLDGGAFRSKWHDCLTGELSAEELQVSANLVQLFANFATTGDPGLGSKPWDREEMSYIKLDKELQIKSDYTKEYHIALNEAREGAVP